MVGCRALSKCSILLVALLVSSCSPFSSKNSPLILILVESFSEQDYLCGETSRSQGFSELQKECDQFLRFTHVYAPSTLHQPSLATLLTGAPLTDHRVLDNGRSGVPASLQTVAELAINRKMRTALISGGAPLQHKFAITQGVEYFSDSFRRRETPLFMPFQESLQKMLDWLDNEVQKESFFVTLYLPDLFHKNQQTVDDLDDERPVNRVSSVLEIHETFNQMIKELKKRGKWANSHVVILGLNGQRTSLNPINPLGSPFLHVPLQIKPAQAFKSNLSERTDDLISFSKLGRWLKMLIGTRKSRDPIEFDASKPDFKIAQQFRWPQWLGLSNWSPRGVRLEQYLFAYSPQLAVYDSYYDKREIDSLPLEEAKKLEAKFSIESSFRKLFAEECLLHMTNSQCPEPEHDVESLKALDFLLELEEVLQAGEVKSEWTMELVSKAIESKNQILINWLARLTLFEKHWGALFDLGTATRNPVWQLVARLNLRENISEKPKGCLRFFVGERHNIDDFYKYCQDSSLRKVVEGLGHLKNKQKASEGFWAEVQSIKSRREAKQLNLEMFFINDINKPFDFAPELAEIYFFLPENSEFLNLVDAKKS